MKFSLASALSGLLLIPAFAQAQERKFALIIINHSPKTIFFGYADSDEDSVLPGKQLNFSKNLPASYFPFYCFVNYHDNPGSAQEMFAVLSDTTARQIDVSGSGKITLTSNSSEKLLEYYFRVRNPSNGRVLTDSILEERSDDIAAAALIKLDHLSADMATDTVKMLFSKLTPRIRSSLIGQSIQRYLDGRARLRVNNRFSDFQALGANDQMLSLSAISSKYILLDFWFARSVTSVAAFPQMADLYRKTPRSVLEIVGISIDPKNLTDLWKQTIASENIPWINLLDPNYSIAGLYSIDLFPTTVLLDENHTIVQINPTMEVLNSILAGDRN